MNAKKIKNVKKTMNAKKTIDTKKTTNVLLINLINIQDVLSRNSRDLWIDTMINKFNFLKTNDT